MDFNLNSSSIFVSTVMALSWYHLPVIFTERSTEAILPAQDKLLNNTAIHLRHILSKTPLCSPFLLFIHKAALQAICPSVFTFFAHVFDVQHYTNEDPIPHLPHLSSSASLSTKSLTIKSSVISPRFIPGKLSRTSPPMITGVVKMRVSGFLSGTTEVACCRSARCSTINITGSSVLKCARDVYSIFLYIIETSSSNTTMVAGSHFFKD